MAQLLQVAAAILAGGKGQRLQPVVSECPKALAPVAGRPFLAWVLDWLLETGVEEVVLCTGYMAGQVEQAFGPRYRGLSLVYSREPQPLGTGGALRLALDRLRGDLLLVLNGDTLCALDVPAMLGCHGRCQAQATMAVARLEDTARFGAVNLSADGRIAWFGEKGVKGAGWVNAGVYLLAREIVQPLEPGANTSLEREVFPALAERGLLRAYTGVRRFLDIGTPESYREAQELLEGNGKLA